MEIHHNKSNLTVVKKHSFIHTGSDFLPAEKDSVHHTVLTWLITPFWSFARIWALLTFMFASYYSTWILVTKILYTWSIWMTDHTFVRQSITAAAKEQIKYSFIAEMSSGARLWLISWKKPDGELLSFLQPLLTRLYRKIYSTAWEEPVNVQWILIGAFLLQYRAHALSALCIRRSERFYFVIK